MSNNRTKAKKKRRISKHITNAKKELSKLEKARATDMPPRTQQENETLETASSPGARTTKDVAEAETYLANWEQQQKEGAAQGIWKFNKNTQSWLIRHMYKPSYVAKNSFALLMEYLGGLKGEDAKARIMADANGRVLRYKKHCKTEEEETKDEERDSENAASKSIVKFSKDTKPEELKEKKSKHNNMGDSIDQATQAWESLDEHDKRKEYKRARKVLEKLQAQ